MYAAHVCGSCGRHSTAPHSPSRTQARILATVTPLPKNYQMAGSARDCNVLATVCWVCRKNRAARGSQQIHAGLRADSCK